MINVWVIDLIVNLYEKYIKLYYFRINMQF